MPVVFLTVHAILKMFSIQEKPAYKSFFFRGGSRAAATSKMERFVITVNGWKPVTIITKHSILYVAVALDPSLLQ